MQRKVFGGIEATLTDPGSAAIYLQSIPYDGTSTWGKGADHGFTAFIDASENMELYDIETDSEPYKLGIHTLPPLDTFDSPEDMFRQVYQLTKDLLKRDKFLTFFGGEHSISIGIIKAYYEYYKDLTILQIDAHADLRPTYMGTPYNHACALHDANKNAHVVQVGIRSMDNSEKEFLNTENCFFAHQLQDPKQWIPDVLKRLGSNVYITFDLDALDPSIMPATGTPEPGGLLWHETTQLLKAVFDQCEVVGFDLVELAPIESMKSPQFLAAKLYYKMLAYRFQKSGHLQSIAP